MLILPGRTASWSASGTSVQMFTQTGTQKITTGVADSDYLAFAGLYRNFVSVAGERFFEVNNDGRTQLDYDTPNTTIRFQINNAGATLRYRADYVVDLTGATPVHLFFSYDISTATPLVYINGVETEPDTLLSGPSSGGTIDIATLHIGNRNNNDFGFSGDFSQIVVKTGSALAISDVYSGGAIADLSGLDASCGVVLDGSRMSVANLNSGTNYGTAGSNTITGTFTDGGTITL